MGVYFNPSNESYQRAKNSRIFMDKTGLIEYLNQRLSTEENCIALSHARRFGKSHAAGMIDAYYSRGCDSSKLFDDTKIAESADYRKYMNQYNVIHLDISSFWDFYKDNIVEKIVEYICSSFIPCLSQKNQNLSWHWHILQEFCQLRRFRMNRLLTISGNTL